MKKTKAKQPLFRQKLPALEMAPEITGAMNLNDVVSLPGIGPTIPVRAAKAKLSALLDLVASGQEIIITSDGRPKARLVPIVETEAGKVFRGMGDYLMSQPIHDGPTADEIIRAERDSRP